MKTVVLAAMISLPIVSQAQQATDFVPFPDNGVYLSANDFTHHVLTDGFDNQPGYSLREEMFKPVVKVTQPNGEAVEIPDAKLWGERKQGADYRFFQGDLYRVEHADRIYIYSKPADMSIAGGGNSNSSTLYYFSRKANSPIHLITADNLEDIYYDQPDKTESFENLDELGKDPARQAAKLVRLFYIDDTPSQAAYKAD
ncbi:hypothetical protein ACFSUS_08925 [Spirosoma soli]|uniref:DKNYY domain-containing protein n=1 Tax=Spirosoma soli TaxID=1770529 RepID=A0ABW5M2H5_9BACT